MNPLTLSTGDGRTQFSPGEQIDVTAEWQLERRPEAVEARLVWYTRGKGDTDVCIVETQRFDTPQPFQTANCRFQLPAAPYSFSGKLISLIWAIELVVEPGGESQRLDIVVAPDGREVEL
jgi:hypothetical protein